MPMSMSISDVLRSAIINTGMSVNALSKASGVSQSALNRFVRGDSELSMASVDILAVYLGLKLCSKGDMTLVDGGMISYQSNEKIRS
jgi:transcriptional regulator with XRE-family HTH domain